MRNDARPIGEKLRQTEMSQEERGRHNQPPEQAREEREKEERKPFVTDRDVNDEGQSSR